VCIACAFITIATKNLRDLPGAVYRVQTGSDNFYQKVMSIYDLKLKLDYYLFCPLQHKAKSRRYRRLFASSNSTVRMCGFYF